MMRKRRYHLYQKYYARGELYNALDQPFNEWHSFNNRDTPEIMIEYPQNVPKDLIWHVFCSLVKVCLFLQHGTSDQNAIVPVADWKPITHRDVHIKNIFIEPHEPSDEDALPNIILADYGESFFPLENPASGPSDSPTEYVLNHNSNRHPPETCHVQHDENDQVIPIGEKSDVWKIGAVIWQMITVDTDLDEVRRENKLKRGRDGRLRSVKCYVCKYYDKPLGPIEILPDPHVFYPSSIGYSEELRDLVRRCMAYYPENRATLRDLNREIEQYLSTHPIQRDNLDLLESRVDNEFALNVPYRKLRYVRLRL
ncbi:hypothetical protein G6514_010474 [Epicoccum nigrum]|nr:hypothetical protein G6514_010474 [Epicoccum nigrum]